MYTTLIVVDDETQRVGDQTQIISFDKYLRDYPKLNESNTRLINLCDTEHYLSKGYYCSLLAEARNHTVLPSVQTINELRSRDADIKLLTLAQMGLTDLAQLGSQQEYFIFFGKVKEPAAQKLAAKLFQQYPAPILKVRLSLEGNGAELNVSRCAYGALGEEERSEFLDALNDFTAKVWRTSPPRKRHRWEMAILVNPEEQVPPSNKEAISRFVKAAGKLGIRAEPVAYRDIQNINSYDALFIRETTAIDHYTYRLAGRAQKNGLVVIDDPTSILRCCNKVFLHDAFSYQKVPSLKTRVITDSNDATLDELEQGFGFPVVLKMPEGSFSKGVYKVKDRQELKTQLDELFKDSALVLAQEYLYTEHDWRIGILNGRALYACRYFMARNHWQIYNHGSSRFFSGSFETLPTFEVPKVVLDAALKAARIIGNSLYGVDIKCRDNYAYVLEVNDNPSIESGVEDAYLGDELYMQIMSEFLRRLESRGR
jgi:glutathione synthase/RimK-type ligase-like ATP-grasp enzyme